MGASILFREGMCVQSIGWNKIRPLGKLSSVARALDEYEVDEIALFRIARETDCYSALCADLDVISSVECFTPLGLGGGFRDEVSLDLVRSIPFERLFLSSAYLSMDSLMIDRVKASMGRQAMVCVLPCRLKNQDLEVFNCSTGTFGALHSDVMSYIQDNADEVLVYDIENEGRSDSFEFRLVDLLELDVTRAIFTGGVGRESIKIAKAMGAAAVVIDNKTLHSEFSIHGKFKNP